jgi:hypothetical protein
MGIGCGWPLEKVEALLKDDPETLAIWRDAVTRPHGGDRTSKDDNVMLAQQGTSKSYTLARLSSDIITTYERQPHDNVMILIPKDT